MQAQTMLALLYIARMDKTDSPATVKDVGDYLGVSTAAASRNVAALSAWSRHQKPGHDLVEATENPAFRSQKFIRLTAKGKRMIKTLEENYDFSLVKFISQLAQQIRVIFDYIYHP